MHPGSAPDPGNAPDPRQIRYRKTYFPHTCGGAAIPHSPEWPGTSASLILFRGAQNIYPVVHQWGKRNKQYKQVYK